MASSLRDQDRPKDAESFLQRTLWIRDNASGPVHQDVSQALDNLAALYTKQQLPGVGASLGLDRLLAALEKLGVMPPAASPAPVLVVQFSADRLADYQKASRKLRQAGIGVEVYPEAKKIGQQLQYGERRGFRVALIAGSEEFDRQVWKLKDLALRQEQTVKDSELLDGVRRMLGN